MGNFLFTIASMDSKAKADELFRLALAHAEQIKSQTPNQLIESGLSNVAAFARINGSGGAIVRDEATGNWLVACGSWFHRHGFATGDESQLLSRFGLVGAVNLARELEGFFVIACGDSRGREVSVITDVTGSRHCFVRAFGDYLAVSTSSLVLASVDDAPLDRIACEEFLRVGVIYEERTLFRDVRKLPSGSVFRFAHGKQTDSVCYWRLGDLDPQALGGNKAAEQLCENLVGAARRIGKAYSHPVCDLTGGYDSRLIVAAFMSAGAPFETTVSGRADSPDVVISKRLSKITGVPHWHNEPDSRITPNALNEALRVTDGEYDLVEYARIQKIHRRLLEKFDVSINGSYGEMCRGYWWEILGPNMGRRDQIDARELARKRYTNGALDSPLFPPDTGLDVVEHLAAIISRYNRDLAGWPNTAQMDNVYLMLRMHRWQGRIASSTDQIWPCLSPFLFRSVLETALQTRVQFRKRSRLARCAMAGLQPKLAAEPLDVGYPPMPLTIKSCIRFTPALHRFAGKVWDKAALKLSGGASTPPITESVRLQLWREGEIRDLLTPTAMRLNGLIEPGRLRDFLELSRQPHFNFDAQWRRLLSLEMTLRSLGSIRKNG